MEIVDKLWISTERGALGIVVGNDKVTGERKAYIALIAGHDEDIDANYVLENGSRFPIEFAQRLIRDLSAGKKQQLTYPVELTFQDLALVIISLELRLMEHRFNTKNDERVAKKLKERLDEVSKGGQT